MNRSFFLRALVACWAIWLGAAISEPGALHSCPMHGNHAAHSMAQMDGHQSPDHSKHTGCTCLGMGCCAAAVSGPAESIVELPTTAVVTTVPVPVARVHFAPAGSPPHALPFANGPPSARLV